MKRFTLMLLALVASVSVSYAQPGRGMRPQFSFPGHAFEAGFAQAGPRFSKGHAYGQHKNDSAAVDTAKNHRGNHFGFGHTKRDSAAVRPGSHNGQQGHAYGKGGKNNRGGFAFGKGGKNYRGGFGFALKHDSFYVANTLAVAPVAVEAGATTAVLPIVLTNDSIIKSVYFTLGLPEGITLAKDAEGKYLVQLNDARATEAHKVISTPSRKKTVAFRLSSQTDAYVGKAGAVAYVTVALDPALQEGEYTIELNGAGLKDANDKRHASPATTSVLTIGGAEVKNVIASDATAISEVDATTAAPRYDLGGRNVTTSTSAGKHIYIQNGRKYVRK